MTYFSKPAHAAAWSVRDSISRITSVALPVALSIALLPLFTANVALAADANLAAGQINQTAVSDATVQTAQIEQVEEISTQVVEQLESSLSANMVLPYDPADIAAIGNQNESGHTICCPSYACAYADAVLDGTVNDHSYYTCSCCMWQDWGGGGSSYRCVGSDEEVLREAGAEVLGIVSIFTYGMRKSVERLAAAEVKNVSLTNFDSIVKAAAEEGYIRSADVNRLLAFRDNPSDESWIGGKQ